MKKNNIVFYIVNYKNGGFVILAADNRSIPILAYSETETFNLNAEFYSSGLVEWLSETKESIKYLRENKIDQSLEAKKNWEDVNIFQKEPPGGGCENEFEQVDRLLSTSWNQGSGFNNYMPLKNCNPPLPNGRAWAGCVPVAIAQMMRYHQYPTNYNWSNMPTNNMGNNTISSFIKDIHDKINYYGSAVHYECDATGVNTDYNTAGLFRNFFGYSTASSADYNSNIIVNELRANRPVILQGGRNANWWIFNNYDDGHMWVCDGFKRSKICIFDDNGNPIGAVHYLYYRMNWGWGGEYNDAWYANNNFNPSTYTFNFQKKMIYNIKP
ncbi:C10 family peptidase [Aequorivita sp. F47161]|uniref:C10 family peptidase n=1 Tax=Aequorivita vitellina TaxID=2874475 RepID=A0A9X1QVR0_9FLAO|nr:C10 family peptidase [Aequorivita vitellina]MCG2419620.1 C10 family peptidase [Aequorivita vitellina]